MCDFIIDSYKKIVDPYLIWEQIDNDICNINKQQLNKLFNKFPEYKYDYDNYIYEKYEKKNLYSNFDEWEDGEFIDDDLIMNSIINVIDRFESNLYESDYDSEYDSE